MAPLHLKYDSRFATYLVSFAMIIGFASLHIFGFELKLILMMTLAGVAALLLLSRPSAQLAMGVVLIAIIANMAGYSFLSHSAEGEKVGGAGADVVAYALPAMLVASIVVLVSRHSSIVIPYLKRNWDVLLFVSVSLISTLFAFNKANALQYSLWFFVSITSALLFWLFVTRSFSVKESGLVGALVVFFGYAPFLLFAIPGILNFRGRYLAVMYASGPFYTYAAAAVFASVLVIAANRRSSLNDRLLRFAPTIIVAAAGLLALVASIFSAKRSVIIAMAVATIVFLIGNLFIRGRAQRGSLIRVVALGIVLAGVVVWAVPRAERTMARFSRVGNEETEDLSIEARKLIIRDGLYVFSKYPVFGVGITNGKRASVALLPSSEVAGHSLHNTLLGIMVEFGSVGLLLFLVIVVRSVRLYFQLPGPQVKLDILLLAIPPGLICLTEYNLPPGQAMFWPLWIALLAPRLLTSYQKAPASE